MPKICKYAIFVVPLRRNLSSIGMRQRVFSILLIAFLAGTYSVPAFGWGQKGHRIIAKIAYESQGYSYTEYAEKLELEYGWAKKYIDAQTDAELLLDTYHLTSDIYTYQDTWDGNTYHYIYRWRTEMEEQLYIAGIRLAKLLNEIYK